MIVAVWIARVIGEQKILCHSLSLKKSFRAWASENPFLSRAESRCPRKIFLPLSVVLPCRTAYRRIFFICSISPSRFLLSADKLDRQAQDRPFGYCMRSSMEHSSREHIQFCYLRGPRYIQTQEEGICSSHKFRNSKRSRDPLS